MLESRVPTSFSWLTAQAGRSESSLKINLAVAVVLVLLLRILFTRMELFVDDDVTSVYL